MSALPPNTPLLRHGLGRGTQRAYAAKPGRITEFGDARRRPERETTILRSGTLPGGLEGVLGHHWYLSDGAGEGNELAAWPNTVVYAELPRVNRVLGQAWFGAAQPVRAAFTLDLSGRRSDPIPAGAPGPDPRRFNLPPGVQVEVEYGVLCAWMRGCVTDPAQLDTLCRAASAVADALGAEVAAEPELRVDVPVGPPADSERRRWVQSGAARVDWPEPPADVDTATAAYGRIVGGRARRFGFVFALVFLMVAVLAAAALLAVGVTTGLAAGGVVTAAFAVWVLWRIVRAAVGLARELSADERNARARPWGLEAFVQGYARSRGLTVEDPAVVQRRFDSPVRGRAVAALHGPDGHLVLWQDPNHDRWVVRVSADGVHADRADWSAAALDAAAATRRTPVAA